MNKYIVVVNVHFIIKFWKVVLNFTFIKLNEQAEKLIKLNFRMVNFECQIWLM